VLVAFLLYQKYFRLAKVSLVQILFGLVGNEESKEIYRFPSCTKNFVKILQKILEKTANFAIMQT